MKIILKKQKKEIANQSGIDLPPEKLQNTLDCIQKKLETLETNDSDFKRERKAIQFKNR